jgi:hypothetical protein
MYRFKRFYKNIFFLRSRLGIAARGLRGIAFPDSPPPDWFMVDLPEHADNPGASRKELSPSFAFASELIRSAAFRSDS